MNSLSHVGRLKAAYTLMDIWYEGWLKNRNDPNLVYRQFALKCKAKGLIAHDRALNKKVDTACS